MQSGSQLVYQHSPSSATCVAIATYTHRTYMKFTPTIPTTLAFQGLPITLTDMTTGMVRLPIVAITTPPAPPMQIEAIATIQRQFRQSLPAWQTPIFGSLRKALKTNMLHKLLLAKASLILVSDASVQKLGHSGFAWVLAHNTTPIWQGMGLAPGPIEDMHLGCAEAFGLLAAFIFLEYYFTCFAHPTSNVTIKCFCDNLGVITTLINMRETTIV